LDFEYTEEFREAYRGLGAKDQRAVDAKLRLLASNYRHPSLRAAKWEEPNTWYARVTKDIRVFYEIHRGFYRLITVGHHDIERRK